MEIRFDGRVVIVTGAGGGLGRAYAIEFARRGAKVVVNDLGGAVDGSGRSIHAAQAVATEIQNTGGEAISSMASVSEPSEARSIVETALREFGGLDIVVNNAGILRDKTFPKLADRDFRAVLDVHLMGSVYCTQAAWPVLRERGYGRVLLTTSVSGLYGSFGQSNYAAAKMGLVGLMKTLHLEGASRGIHVNCIAPGASTRMTQSIGLPPERLAAMRPELVVPAAVFLCSEAAPSGIVVGAGAGYFTRVEVMEGNGVRLGGSASVEEFAASFARICEMEDPRSFPSGAEAAKQMLG